MLKEPFYGHYLSSFHKATQQHSDTNPPLLEIKPIGNSDIQISYCHQQWQTLSDDLALGALKHEALHLVLGHVFLRSAYSDSARFDLAADLVVNQYLSAEQLAPDAVSLAAVNHWLEALGRASLEANRELDYYYQALPPSSQQPQCPGVGQSGQGHGSWNRLSTQSQAQQSLVRQQLESKLLQSAQRTEVSNAQSRGLLPAMVLAAVEEALSRRRPVVNWRRLLRLFAASAQRTFVKNTLRRPSKRYGTTPGTKIQPHQHILVAVDTSASVDDQQLQIFFEEMHHIWRAGAQLTVVECDTKINRQYAYQGKPPEAVVGRGGTDFNAAIDTANRLRVDATIYFTDGEAPAPEVRPRAPLLWLIHGLRSVDNAHSLSHCGRVIPMATDPHR